MRIERMAGTCAVLAAESVATEGNLAPAPVLNGTRRQGGWYIQSCRRAVPAATETVDDAAVVSETALNK